ncbi:unnamed protein product [Urochloa humidicola]
MVSPCRKEPSVAARVIAWQGGERSVVAVAVTAAAVVIKPVMLVTVEVQDTQRRVAARTMRRTDKLQGLMDYYYDVAGVGARGTGRFVFDGKRVKGEHTPEDLNMVSGDKIDFFQDLLAG